MAGPAPQARTLAALGASATRGSMSYDWVGDLGGRLSGSGWTCLNFARNGRRAADVRRALGAAIRQRPDAIVIMVGVNDVNARTAVSDYRAELEEIVRRLQADTTARLGLCTLTVIGDDPDGPVMRRAAAFNAAVREVAAAAGVVCIDVAGAQIAWLERDGRLPATLGIGAFLPLMFSAILQHALLFRSWDQISGLHGLRLTTDLVHQNSTGGKIIADLVEGFVREEPAPG